MQPHKESNALQHAVPRCNMQSRVATCCALCQIKMQLRKKKYVFTTADATVQRLQKAYWKQVSACVLTHSGQPHREYSTPRVLCAFTPQHLTSAFVRVPVSTMRAHEDARMSPRVPCPALRFGVLRPFRTAASEYSFPARLFRSDAAATAAHTYLARTAAQ